MNEVLQKIERIRSIFLDTLLFYSNNNETDALIEYLEKTETIYRSIAYEAISMEIAITDLQNNRRLDNWLSFARGPGQVHTAQVYVGLGWAIAKLNLPFAEIVEMIEAHLCHRVADGCGYYDGSFRQRISVMSMQSPVYLPEALMPAYDQGIGRSLWYTCDAEPIKVKDKIEHFPVSRQADLWRGIGIAVAYVGGCDEEKLRTLLEYVTINRIQLAYGAALAVKSRMEANSMNVDTDRCARLWYSLTAKSSNISLKNSVENDTSFNEKAFTDWMLQVEEGLVNNSFE